MTANKLDETSSLSNSHQTEEPVILSQADQQQKEIDTFKDTRKQIYEMLTRSKKSQFNNPSNMNSIMDIKIMEDRDSSLPYLPQKTTQTAYIESECGEKVVGSYFLTHDETF